MKSTLTEILRAVDNLITSLSRPLQDHELANGWNDLKRNWFLDYTRTLREKLPVDYDSSLDHFVNISIVRTMDDWGIIGGEIMEDAAKVSHLIRQAAQARMDRR